MEIYDTDTKTTIDKFKVINETYGIIASPKAMTKKEAETFINKFTGKFKIPGNYNSSNIERINPRKINFSIDNFDNLPF